MEISERTRVPAPLAEVWPLLADPALVAACIPGAQLAPDEGDGVWRGSVRVRFGPTVATFRGEATLAFTTRRSAARSRAAASTGAAPRAPSPRASCVATAGGDETVLRWRAASP